MSTTTALAITVVAAIAYIAASVYAAHRQAKWMAEMEEKLKTGERL